MIAGMSHYPYLMVTILLSLWYLILWMWNGLAISLLVSVQALAWFSLLYAMPHVVSTVCVLEFHLQDTYKHY